MTGQRCSPAQEDRPGRRRGRFHAVLLLGVLLALTAAGCSDGGGQGMRGADGRPVTLPDRGAPDIRDWYDQLRAVRADPEHTVEGTMAACMRAAGWLYVALPRDAFSSAPLPASWADDERVLVTATGYQLVPQLPWEHGTVNAGREGLSAAQDAAFSTALSGPVEESIDVDDPVVGGTVGHPASGCRAEAVTEVYGSVEAYLAADSLAGNLHLQALAAAADSSDVAVLDRRWRECLAEALGDEAPRDVDESWQAVAAVMEEVGEDGPIALTTGASGRLAAADATCRVSTGYTTARAAVEDRHLSAWRDAYATEAAAARSLYERAAQSRA